MGVITIDLSRNVIKEFAEITSTEETTSSGLTSYGTIVSNDGSLYVQLDGSEQVTPVSSTTDAQEGDRVIVMVKNHEATILGSTTSPSARVAHVNEVSGEVSRLDGEIVKLAEVVADKATIGDLSATNAEIGKLQAKDVEIENLVAKKADITDLNATNITVGNLDAEVAEINTLIFGSASGDVIQSEFSNAVVAEISDAQIKSAMIQSLVASKISAGTINTTNVTLKSDDGLLSIADETIQISDGTRVRVQIGKDASEDYSINVWDANGKLMFSQGGITDAAIKDAIIRDDMVSDTANINAGKLDISSLFTEINEAGDETITSNKILIDMDTGTLDVAFKNMTNTVNDMSETVTSQGTALTIVEGKIDSKVWQQDIITAIDDSRNLLLNSSNLEPLADLEETSKYGAAYNASGFIENYSNGCTAAKVTQGQGLGFYADAFDFTSEETYTFSGTFDNQSDTDVDIDLYLLQRDVDGTRVYLIENANWNVASIAAGSTERVSTQLVVSDDWFDVMDSGTVRVTLQNATLTNSGEVWCYAPKLEKGDIATDWSPAPEDTATLSTQYSELEQDLSGFKMTVSNTYQTKDAMGEYSTIDNTNSLISQTATKITTTVSETYVTQTEFDDLEIGGRNLYKGSADFSGELWINIDGWSTTEETDIYGNAVRSRNLQWYGLSQEIEVKAGENYILSASVRGDGTSTYWFFVSELDENRSEIAGSFIGEAVVAPTTETRVNSGAYTVVNDCLLRIRVENNIADSTLWVSSLKMEKGNKATDWTPAPEDLESRMFAAETAIEQNANSITFSVKTANEAKDAANTAKSTADKAASTANTAKSTADGAASAASTAQTTADNAASAANTAKSTADKAASTANTAKSTADGAASAASTAQSTADKAASTANTAKSTADGAASAASTAQTTADNAASAASTAQTTADNAASAAEDVAKDLADHYYTKTETEAAIELTETGILSTVSETYATNATVSGYETRISTVEQTADDFTVRLDVLESSIGNRNYLLDSEAERIISTSNTASVRYEASSELSSSGATQLTVSVFTKGSVSGLTTTFYLLDSNGNQITPNITYDVTTEYARVAKPVTFRSGYSISDAVAAKFRLEESGTLYLKQAKLEIGDTETAWMPAYEEMGDPDAAKTATNYLNFSTDGLVVGNMTADTLEGNVLIDTDSVDIRKNTTVLATFAEKLLELGKNAKDAVIKLCNGLGTIAYNSDEDYLEITGDNLRLRGETMASLYTYYTNGSNIIRKSAVNVESNNIYAYSQTCSNAVNGTGTFTTSEYNLSPSTFSVVANNVELTGREGISLSVVTGNIATDAPVELHAMSVVCSTAKTLSTSFAKITMSTLYESSGHLLSQYAGGIKCAVDGKVLVFGAVHATGLTAGNTLGVNVYKNTTGSGYSYVQTGSKTFATCQVTPKILEVAAGNVIYLYAQNYNTAIGNVNADTRTMLTVMYIE